METVNMSFLQGNLTVDYKWVFDPWCVLPLFYVCFATLSPLWGRSQCTCTYGCVELPANDAGDALCLPYRSHYRGVLQLSTRWHAARRAGEMILPTGEGGLQPDNYKMQCSQLHGVGSLSRSW